MGSNSHEGLESKEKIFRDMFGELVDLIAVDSTTYGVGPREIQNSVRDQATEERPYQCQPCNTTFGHRMLLQEHLLSRKHELIYKTLKIDFLCKTQTMEINTFSSERLIQDSVTKMSKGTSPSSPKHQTSLLNTVAYVRLQRDKLVENATRELFLKDGSFPVTSVDKILDPTPPTDPVNAYNDSVPAPIKSTSQIIADSTTLDISIPMSGVPRRPHALKTRKSRNSSFELAMEIAHQLQCSTCEKVFQFRSCLNRHIIEQHKVDTQTTTLFTCSVGNCNKTFKRRFAWRAHESICARQKAREACAREISHKH